MRPVQRRLRKPDGYVCLRLSENHRIDIMSGKAPVSQCTCITYVNPTWMQSQSFVLTKSCRTRDQIEVQLLSFDDHRSKVLKSPPKSVLYITMKRAQSARHYVRPSHVLATDDLGVLREGDESSEDTLRRQLMDKEREIDRVSSASVGLRRSSSADSASNSSN